MLGYIGFSLLVIAYFTLISKWDYLFVPIDIIASAILTVHAILLKDLPFVLVNGMVTVVLIIKLIQKGTKI